MAGLKECLVIAALAMFAGPAAAADASLFDAFQKYCVATNAEIDAVAAAVGRDHAIPDEINVEVKPGSKMLQWDIPNLDYALSVTVVAGEPGSSMPPGTHSAVCTVLGKTDATTSLAALRAWVGIPPGEQTSVKGVVTYKYAFVQQGNTHTALPFGSDPAFDDAVEHGGAWRLVAMGNPSDGFFALSHYFVPPSTNN